VKIICTDNFAREERADSLVAENLREDYAEEIAKFLNEKYGGADSPNYFKAVPDDYKLWKGMEELV